MSFLFLSSCPLLVQPTIAALSANFYMCIFTCHQMEDSFQSHTILQEFSSVSIVVKGHSDKSYFWHKSLNSTSSNQNDNLTNYQYKVIPLSGIFIGLSLHLEMLHRHGRYNYLRCSVTVRILQIQLLEAAFAFCYGATYSDHMKQIQDSICFFYHEAISVIK